MRSFIRVFCAVWVSLFSVAAAGPAFEFKDGDRVVFLGDTWVEREQQDGHVETRLTAHLGGKKVIFRNLAWSADTVLGESRASFDPPEKGFELLKEQLGAIKPTVAFLGYGMAESFKGEAGVEKFKRDLHLLMDTIEGVSKPDEVRFVLLTPLWHENLGAPLPNPAAHNEQLRAYAKAVTEVAEKRGARLVDLFTATAELERSSGPKLTDNGIHPTPEGFERIAGIIEKSLGLGSSETLSESQVEGLRQTIVKKNELFFHRWRPQNQTYLFGFRRHEQGQNAKEIPMFDPLIAEQEERIFALASKSAPAELPAEKAPEKKAAAETFDATPLPRPTFDMGPDLEVTLFAENPDLAKPIHMNFDPQGRLWVASSEVYPQIEPGQKATDKILILEDTDNDGQSDKTTIFADGLLIPTGVEPGDGGAYVANSTELLFYKDTDGDGRADHKQVMLSGFGTEDTHHILHTLRWGHDGQLYMNQSIYIHSHIETPHGVVRLDSGGILNFRPPTRELGIHMKGLINSWGHHFDKFGQSFATDGAGHEGINWIVPQAMYVTYEGARRILHGVSPGNYPKFCGLEVIESPHFPEDWQGTMVTCDFRAHRVVHFAINEQGSGYVTKELPDIMRTTNVTFRPIDAKIGPDGALYIADWSNPIIQHGEVDFRDPRRDHEHGRIWKVTHKKGKLLAKTDLLKASNSDLLDNLLSANGQLRQQSRRVLTERGGEIESDLKEWTSKQQTEEGKLEALWMYQSIDQVNAPLLKKVLAAKDGRIRAAGARVISFWHPRLENPLDLLEPLVSDSHARVRVEAVRAAAKIPSARAAALVLSALEHPMDRFLDYAIWLSINDLAEPWIAAIQDGSWKWEGREKQLEFGLNAVEPHLASRVLEKILAEKPLPKDGSGPWLELLSRAGSPKQLNTLLDQVLASHFTEEATAKALHALAEAGRLRNVGPSAGREKIKDLFTSKNDSVRAAAIRLGGQWKLREFRDDLLKVAASADAPDNVRAAAFQSLREFGGDDTKTALASLAGAENPLPSRIQAVTTLAALDLKKAAPLAVEVLAELPDEAAALNLWRSLLANKGAAAALTQALPRGGLPAPMVKAGLRAAREGGRNEPNLVMALARNTDEGEARNLSPEELNQLLSFIREKGDPARGELIYRRLELGCVSCHAIGGVGGKVGPDMTSIGASAPLDYLVESLQFPARKVKEGYHSLLIETEDEEELSGILLRETDEQLILRDATDREISIAKNNIRKRTIGGSIMPAGLVDALNEQEQADLYRFLSELGKPGPYDASRGNVARTWRLMPRTLDLAQFDDAKIIAMNRSDWTPATTFVDGRLPRPELEAPIKRLQYRDPDAVYASTRFQVPKEGPVRIELPNLEKAALWIDGKLVPAQSRVEVNLPAGTHVLTVKLQASALPDFLRASSPDATFINQ